MQSILRWSLENSTPLDSAPSDQPPAERKPIDPGIIDAILGRPDSELMKEDMAVATDVSRSEDERVTALDHLEMLIEHIDNANDLVKLNLWEPLHKLTTDDGSTPSIRTQALWVIGTALQNNPPAQDVYLSLNPLPSLLSVFDPSTSAGTGTRAKAVYVLSGLLKHNNQGVKAMSQPDVDGWTKIKESLQNPSISVRRKIIFLLATLLTPSSPSSPSRSSAPLLLADAPNRSALHASESPLPTPSAPAMHGPGVNPSSEPIHANSHAAHLRDPSRASTWRETVAAFEKYHILDAIISALTDPLPYGEDGEFTEPDADFQEKGVALLSAYAVACGAPLAKEQKAKVRNWIQSEKKAAAGGEAELLERWSLTRADYASLIGKLL